MLESLSLSRVGLANSRCSPGAGEAAGEQPRGRMAVGAAGPGSQHHGQSPRERVSAWGHVTASVTMPVTRVNLFLLSSGEPPGCFLTH